MISDESIGAFWLDLAVPPLRQCVAAVRLLLLHPQSKFCFPGAQKILSWIQFSCIQEKRPIYMNEC